MIRTLKRLWYRFRSSITGKFVSKDYADKHPDTTQREKP